jgi:hypothetical protein
MLIGKARDRRVVRIPIAAIPVQSFQRRTSGRGRELKAPSSPKLYMSPRRVSLPLVRMIVPRGTAVVIRIAQCGVERWLPLQSREVAIAREGEEDVVSADHRSVAARSRAEAVATTLI